MSKSQKQRLKRIIISAALFIAALVIPFEKFIPGEAAEWIPAAMYLAAYLIIGWSVLTKAFRNILHGQIFDENFLMAVATIGAVCLKDYKEAVNWLRKSAEQGYADAQLDLGVCYDYGNGVPQDHKEAVKWYRKSAEQGNADAQYNLGVSYEIGEGVKKDTQEALKWYKKAADQGYEDAIEAIKNLNR